MIRLDTTTRKLQLILAGAITTTQPDVVVSYSDATASAYTGGSQVSVGNSTTAVDICAAPAASTVRDVDHLTVRNNDTVAMTVTVRLNDNATLYKLVSIALAVGDTLEYAHAAGWRVMDAMGNIKQSTVSSTALMFAAQSTNALKCYLMPSMSDGWRGIWRAGFDWWSRNQQWGGPFGFMNLVDGATSVAYSGEAATGNIESNSQVLLAQSAARTHYASGFKVPETQTVAAIWVKLAKVGNPTNNAGLFIYTDNGAGKPNALHTNGTATAQSGKLVGTGSTSDGEGNWFRFVFATPPTLVGGTQYHVVMKSSGAVDASNYWIWRTGTSKYPFGYFNEGDATPTWTSSTGAICCFLVELSATAQTLQSGGQFDGKLAFGGSGASGTLSMSRGLCNSVPLRELMDIKEGTISLIGTALTKDVTFLDIGYGEDHDRIVLRCNVTTGYAQGNVYESGGTNTAVTATATDLSSGTHLVGIYWRAMNDGADRIDVRVDDVTYSSATNLSLDFDALMAELGTMWVGGGFALAPTWTGNAMTDTAQLPSHANNGSWTWTGTGTEANCMSMQGGKLRQNKNGYASTNTGYYAKTMTFSNTNGWAVQSKFQILSAPNTYTASLQADEIDIYDGAKRHLFAPQEYFSCQYNGSWNIRSQQNYKAAEVVSHIIGKGSDALQFLNRKLTEELTGSIIGASATNSLQFGDADSAADSNSDEVWSYVKYYNTAWNPPQFTSGSISEFAIWQGNLKALWPLLYNSGTFVSVKTLLGVRDNYIDKSDKIPAKVQRGITNAPTSTATTLTEQNECGAFVVGEVLDCNGTSTTVDSTGGIVHYAGFLVDGAGSTSDGETMQEYLPTANSDSAALAPHKTVKSYLGLHKVSLAATPSSACTWTMRATNRALNIKALP